MDDHPPADLVEAPEPDEATVDMFGGAPSPQRDAGDGYQVLARKYRPRTFHDLIGQEGMVRTLTNAIESVESGEMRQNAGKDHAGEA